jgi:hypothetical protein
MAIDYTRYLDGAQELDAAEQRRKFAQALLEQSAQSNPTQVISGYAVKQSPFEGLSKIGQALLARSSLDDANKSIEDIKLKQDQSLGNLFGDAPTQAQAPIAPNLQQQANAPQLPQKIGAILSGNMVGNSLQPQQPAMSQPPPDQATPQQLGASLGGNPQAMPQQMPQAQPTATKRLVNHTGLDDITASRMARLDPAKFAELQNAGQNIYEATHGIGVNPTTGKPEMYQSDKSGGIHWSGISPDSEIVSAGGGRLYDKRTGKLVTDLGASQYENAQLGNERSRIGLEGQRVSLEAQRNADLRKKGETDPLQVEQLANAVASGKLAPFTGMAARSPMAAAVMARAFEINPDMNTQDYKAQQAAVIKFGSGSLGTNARSIGVSIDHIDQLRHLGTAMQNGNIPALNKINNYISKEMGHAPPTNFDGIKTIVADEITKSVLGGPGGVHDREQTANAMRSASSPEQLNALLDNYQNLMRGQLNGLRRQYETTTGRNDFDKKLSDATKEKLENGDGAATTTNRSASYQSYKTARDAAYISGNYTLVHQLDAKAKQIGDIK